MKLLPSLLVLASLTAATFAQLAPGAAAKPTPEQIFKRLDGNKDGKITLDELPTERRDNFKRIDTNGDGGISLAEHLAFLNARGAAGRPATPNSSPAIEVQTGIAYAGNDNPRQQLDLFLPRKRNSDKPLPVVVFIHGGGWKAGNKSDGSRSLEPFVASGDYAGVPVGYRLTNEAQWPAQIHDCKAAIRWVKAHAKEYHLDADHIGVWGTSAGGHLVSILGTSGDVPELEGRLGSNLKQSSRVACVVNYFGPENFITMATQKSTVDRTTRDYPEALLIGGRVQDQPDAARRASPVTYISKDDPPFLTAHGTEDPLVPFAQATELHEALKKVGVFSTLLTMQNGGHGFGSKLLEEAVKRFLDKHLRGMDAKIEDQTIELPPAPAKP
ncbi:MAG: putative lipase/esterase [Verrucomicrobiaceae bacterium]|nr:putative lipase/esterase [Verrucomicrobiaceae bacterium]